MVLLCNAYLLLELIHIILFKFIAYFGFLVQNFASPEIYGFGLNSFETLLQAKHKKNPIEGARFQCVFFFGGNLLRIIVQKLY